jgi:hypothetical protein
MFKGRIFFFAAFLGLTAQISLFAQGARGTIYGMVYDATGSVIPQATVVATNIDTNVANGDEHRRRKLLGSVRAGLIESR